MSILLPSLRGGLIGSSGVPRVAGNNKVAVVGDSRSGWAAGPVGAFNCRYPVTAARQKLKSRMVTDWNYMFQTGGFTVNQIVTTHYAAAKLTDAKTCLFFGGVNDAGGDPTASFNLIRNAAIDWTGRGPDYCFVVLNEVPPGAGWPGNMTGHVALRDLINTLDNPVRGIRVVDSWLAATGDNSNTPIAGTYMVGDTVHFATAGAYNLGTPIGDVMSEVLPAYDVMTADVPTFSQALALGTIASNDLATNRTGSVGTYTVSMVTFEGDTWCQIVAAGADGQGNVYRSSSTVPGDFVAGTTKVQSVCEYVLLDGHSNVRNFNLGAYKQSGGNLVANVPSGAAGMDGHHSGSGSDVAVGSFPPGEHRGYLWTPVSVYAADATQFKPWWVQLASRTAGGMNATLLFRKLQCRKLA